MAMMYNLNRDYGRMYPDQNTYGWGNAVQDILGAVMKRNADRSELNKQSNMYGDVANFNNNLNNLDYGGQTTTQDLSSPATPSSDYTGKNIQNQVTQGLLPTTNINPQTPTSNDIGQGLLGSTGYTLPTDQSQINAPTTVQPQTYQFNNPMDKYSAANNPTQTTTSAPKSLVEQTNLVKSQYAPAMQELVKKYGIQNAPQISAMLQQSMKDTIAQHTQDYNQQQAQNLMQQFQSTNDPMQQAAIAARLKQQFGYDVGSAYKDFKHDYSSDVVDTGDSKNLLSFDKSTGRYATGGQLANHVSPTDQAKMQNAKDIANINGQYHLQGANISAAARASRGSSSKPDPYWSNYANHGSLDRDQGLVDEYNQRVHNGDYISPAEQTKYNNASVNVKAYQKNTGGGDQTPSQNYVTADNQLAELKAAHPDATNWEIVQFLNSKIRGE